MVNEIIVQIREGNKEDIIEISKCDQEVFEDSYGISYFEKLFELPKISCYILEKELDIIGYVFAYPLKDDCTYIASIGIKEKYQRKGYGRQLMDKIIKTCTTTKIGLHVNVENHRAIDFYQKNNFNPLGIIENYYGDKIHAYIMIKFI